MSGGGVGNTTNTSNVGGLGSAMGQLRPQVQPIQIGQAAGNPFGGGNPAVNQFFNNQPRPQVLPQVTPQVQQPAPQAVPSAYQNYMQAIVGNPQLGGMGISGVTGGMPAQGMGTPTTYLPPPTTQTEAINRLGGMGIAGVRQLPFQGGMGLGGVGRVPDYAQPYYQDLLRRQQQPLVSLPRQQPQVQPMPRPQLGGMGLAGLANAMRGRR